MRAIQRYLFCVLSIVSATVMAQKTSTPSSWQMNASAVVVKNIETSSRWYSSVFGLTQKSRMDDPSGAYKVVILESPKLMIELIEMKGAVPRSTALEGKPEGTQLQGHFKIGFKVPDIDACIAHLKTLNIEVPKVWTDATTKKRNFLITDPDGNYVQFFD